MIASGRTVLVLLAAGRSTRFGEDDKLMAPLGGQPLYRHAVDAVASVDFLGRVVVTSGTSVALGGEGYERVINPAPERGLSGSLTLGVGAARRLGAAAMLVMLADMPFVTPAHVRALFAAADGPGAVVASGDGARTSPPALFAAGRFAELGQLSGDRGARALLGTAALVTTTAHMLADIDTPADLAAAQAWLAASAPQRPIRGAARQSG